MTSWNVFWNLLRDGDALLVWHGVTLLGDDCPALLLLHHLALLLVVSLARENNQARNFEFLFQNMIPLQVSLSLCNVYSISCLALVLQHSGALLLTHGPAGRLVHWNQTRSRDFSHFKFRHLSGKPALVPWYTHPVI